MMEIITIQEVAEELIEETKKILSNLKSFPKDEKLIRKWAKEIANEIKYAND